VEWKIKASESGGYRIFDQEGKVAGSYGDRETAAIHHAYALQERRKATRALLECLDVLDKGLGLPVVRDTYPDFAESMRKAKEKVRSGLGFDRMTPIPVTVEEDGHYPHSTDATGS